MTASTSACSVRVRDIGDNDALRIGSAAVCGAPSGDVSDSIRAVEFAAVTVFRFNTYATLLF